jgi:type IV pilus assembly protein PilC
VATDVRNPPHVGLKSLAHGFAQFAAMMRAGLPLAPALSALARQAVSRPWRQLLYRVRAEVETGTPLSQAFARHDPRFPRWVVALLRAGEAAGMLEMVLEQIAEQFARSLALQGRLRTALSYPLVVLVVAVGVTGFLIAGVVPQFASILTQLGGELPPATQALLALSGFLRRNAVGLGLTSLALLLVGARLLRLPRWRAAAQQVLGRLPGVGGLLRARAVAVFARTTAMLLRAGVPVSDALAISQGVVSFEPLERAIHDARLGVTRGEPLSRRFRRHPQAIPPLLLAMLAVGEETGNLPEMLARIAVLFEREVDDALAVLAANLEPMLVVCLALVVGWVVAAVATPMMALVGAIG